MTAPAALPAALVAQATVFRLETLNHQERRYDGRTLYKQVVRLGQERHTWYQVIFWSERFGTSDSSLSYATLEEAQAAYAALF